MKRAKSLSIFPAILVCLSVAWAQPPEGQILCRGHVMASLSRAIDGEALKVGLFRSTDPPSQRVTGCGFGS